MVVRIQALKQLALEEAGASARLRLFGSRLDDNARGGDFGFSCALCSVNAGT